MSFTIRWTTPLNRTERRWLNGWLSRLTGREPELVQRRPGALRVQCASPEVVHSFAALTMAIIGRDPFAYELAQTQATVGSEWPPRLPSANRGPAAGGTVRRAQRLGQAPRAVNERLSCAAGRTLR